MSSGDSSPNVNVGNKVCFIGGPEAGNVRVVPESHGEYLQTDGGYVYRIWPFKMKGDRRTVYFAYDAQEHPIKMLIDMWRDYSPTAQIKRDVDKGQLTYSTLGK